MNSVTINSWHGGYETPSNKFSGYQKMLKVDLIMSVLFKTNN